MYQVMYHVIYYFRLTKKKHFWLWISVHWETIETIVSDNWNNVPQVLMTSEFQDQLINIFLLFFIKWGMYVEYV